MMTPEIATPTRVMTTIVTGSIAILLYLLASILLTLRLAHCYSGPGCRRNEILLISGIAIVLHAMLVYPSIMTPHGLDLAFFNAISLIFLITAALLMLASLQEPVENLGIPVFPLSALSVGLMLLFPGNHVATERSYWQLDIHILISLLAYSILGLAVLQALLLAIQDRHLHNRQPGGFIRSLPPLQTMEALMFQMVAIGFALLTLALVTGMLFVKNIFAQHLVHKTVLSIIAWVVFATLLWGRWRYGWRSRIAINWTVGGFVFLMLAYFGSKFVLELVLKR
jgi:ABC-type uncharacterized transport system permease subunit